MQESKRFKLSDVSDLDLMMLFFILEPIYTKRAKYYNTNLKQICKWIIKTIIVEHNYYRNSYYYMNEMSKKFKAMDLPEELIDKGYFSRYPSSYLNSRVVWNLVPNQYRVNGDDMKVNKARKDMYDLLTRDINGFSVRNYPDNVMHNTEFDNYCYHIIKTYIPEFYKKCMMIK